MKYDLDIVSPNMLTEMILAASAICTEDGIAARIEFNRFFDGKIYSIEYPPTNPDCIYHNTTDTPTLTIEFVIPLNKCGTRISRNTRNVIISMFINFFKKKTLNNLLKL